MGSANLELVRSIVAAWERGDYGSAEWAHPEIELVFAELPDLGTWTGLAGLGEGWRRFLSSWEEFHNRADRFVEVEGERVLVLTRFGGRGKRSGLEVGEMQAKGAVVFQLRGGKVTSVVLYGGGVSSRERAFADLGLAGKAGSPPS